MSKIRDIIGMCHLIDGLEFSSEIDGINGVVNEFDREIFYGNIQQCFNYISLYKRMAKHKQVADLLETICRANIQGLNEWEDFDGAKAVAQNWKKEVEAVYLSDDEVNEREIKEKQG